jgi:hypothetical protein
MCHFFFLTFVLYVSVVRFNNDVTSVPVPDAAAKHLYASALGFSAVAMAHPA